MLNNYFSLNQNSVNKEFKGKDVDNFKLKKIG